MRKIIRTSDVASAKTQLATIENDIAALQSYKDKLVSITSRASKTTQQLELENARRYATNTQQNASAIVHNAKTRVNTYASGNELRHVEKVALSYAARDNSLRALYVELVNAHFTDEQIVHHVCHELQKSNEKQVLRQLAFIRKHL